MNKLKGNLDFYGKATVRMFNVFFPEIKKPAASAF